MCGTSAASFTHAPCGTSFLQTDQIDSSITVVNAITSAVQGTVRVSGSGHSWLQLYKAAPVETKSISIHDIISKLPLSTKKNYYQQA